MTGVQTCALPISPFFARVLAAAIPIPLEAPVITIDLPARPAMFSGVHLFMFDLSLLLILIEDENLGI